MLPQVGLINFLTSDGSSRNVLHNASLHHRMHLPKSLIYSSFYFRGCFVSFDTMLDFQLLVNIVALAPKILY